LSTYTYDKWSSIPNYKVEVTLLTGNVVYAEPINYAGGLITENPKITPNIAVPLDQFKELARGKIIYVGVPDGFDDHYAVIIENNTVIGTDLDQAVTTYVEENNLSCPRWDIKVENGKVIASIEKASYFSSMFLSAVLGTVLVALIYVFIVLIISPSPDKREKSYAYH